MEAELSRLGGLPGAGRGVVSGGLELDRRDESQLAVETSVVVLVDVLGDRDLQVVDPVPRALVPYQLGLEQQLNASAMALS